MSITELIEEAKKKVITQEDIDSFNELVRKANEEFEERERIQRLNYQKFLDFRYTI